MSGNEGFSTSHTFASRFSVVKARCVVASHGMGAKGGDREVVCHGQGSQAGDSAEKGKSEADLHLDERSNGEGA